MADVSKIKLPDGITYDVKDTTKQPLLVSGTNIKTINNQSLLGSGNLTIGSGGGGLQNLVDGSVTGSVRGINTATEDSSYTMGLYAFAEGGFTKASGYSSHAEGSGSTASGNSSHAEGSSVTASGSASHAEGAHTTASGSESHAEGWQTTANDEQSHAEGYMTIASNTASHAEGQFTLAGGTWSHAEGYYTQASGETSHSQNAGTIAQRKSQTALGEYNIADTTGTTTTRGDYTIIVGNGADDNNRSNALTVDWSGNVNIASGAHYKINGTNLNASDVGAQATLVSGTNIKTINNQSLLGSGDLTINVPTKTSDLTNDSGFITASVATATPTADTISKFDSTAHMNSTDMTSSEVTSFVNGLNMTASKAVDYIVEQGTDGIWTYRKWQSGIAECWGVKSETLTSYTTWNNMYAYATTVTFPQNLFVEIPIITYSACVGTSGFALTGSLNSTLTTTGTRLYTCSSVNGSSTSQTTYWYIQIIGRWK